MTTHFESRLPDLVERIQQVLSGTCLIDELNDEELNVIKKIYEKTKKYDMGNVEICGMNIRGDWTLVGNFL
jgi:hypothetical protein